MKNLHISNHKNLLCIIGLVFIVGLKCCIFPVGNFTLESIKFDKGNNNRSIPQECSCFLVRKTLQFNSKSNILY